MLLKKVNNNFNHDFHVDCELKQHSLAICLGRLSYIVRYKFIANKQKKIEKWNLKFEIIPKFI